jgi:hypothetical protein
MIAPRYHMSVRSLQAQPAEPVTPERDLLAGTVQGLGPQPSSGHSRRTRMARATQEYCESGA